MAEDKKETVAEKPIAKKPDSKPVRAYKPIVKKRRIWCV